MKVGFIGVGNMGGPMCRNIIRNTNHDVVVFDLNPAAIKACTDLGATAGTSVAQVAAACDVVFTSLPMPRNVEEVALGAGGIAESAKAGTVYVDLSTNSPATARRVNEGMRAKGIQMLEAPVSGGVPRATDGTIVIMVGGDAAAFDAQLPLLKSFSGEVVHVGEIGMGSVAKLVNNMLAFCNAAAAAEALMIGTMAGIDLHKLQQVISNASGNSSAFRNISRQGVQARVPGDLRAQPRAQGSAARTGAGRRTRRARHDRAAGDEPDAHRSRQGHGRRRQQFGDPRL